MARLFWMLGRAMIELWRRLGLIPGMTLWLDVGEVGLL